MNFEFFISRRVAANGQQSFSRIIIRIAAAAVALSIAVMIASTSLISGFKHEISSKIFGFWGHIHITDLDVGQSLLDAYPIHIKQSFYPSLDTVRNVPYKEEVSRFGKIVEKERLTKKGIRHIQTFALKPGIIKSKSEIEGIILKGVGKDYDWSFIEHYIKKGQAISRSDSAMSSDILISQQTADRLRVDVGDKFIVHFVEKGEQLKRRFNICGIFRTGLEEYDRKFALVDIRQIQRLLGWSENEVGGFEVIIEDIDDLLPIEDFIYSQLPNDLNSETIRSKFPEIFEWLELQNINETVILSLMLCVAIINMMTALLILILERANMIGILKALGSANWSIRRVFLYYAAYIMVAGLFWGNLIGIGLCWLQDRFGFIQLDEANYYLSVAPVEINLWTILLLNVGTLLITLLFLIIPSYLVSKISPVKAIRFK